MLLHNTILLKKVLLTLKLLGVYALYCFCLQLQFASNIRVILDFERLKCFCVKFWILLFNTSFVY